MTQQRLLTFYIGCFVAFGFPALFFPTEFATLLGYELAREGALMEFTGAYGGLILGIAAYLIYCLKAGVSSGLVAVLMVIGGLFVGRLFGLAIDGTLNSIQISFLAIEAITIVLVSSVLKFSHAPRPALIRS